MPGHTSRCAIMLHARGEHAGDDPSPPCDCGYTRTVSGAPLTADAVSGAARTADGLDDMNDAADALDPEMLAILSGATDYQNLKVTLDEFEHMHDTLAQMKADLKEIEEKYDAYRKVIVPESMKVNGILDQHGKGSCTTPTGRKVYITTDTRAYIKKEDEAEAHKAIQDMGYGELIRPNIHPSTLTAFIRERLENGEEVPPGVQMYQQEKAVLRKS